MALLEIYIACALLNFIACTQISSLASLSRLKTADEGSPKKVIKFCSLTN